MGNKLEILYEDNHIIVVVKPVNVLSQADNTNDLDMLTMLKSYIKEKYNKPGNVYLGLVHRLDRMTSGIMVFARTSKAASRLNEQIRKGEFNKRYYALVEGELEGEGELVDYLFKDEKQVKSFVANDDKVGKLSKLIYKAQKYGKNQSLVEIELITGRHHQIRVQMANIGHPLVGDSLYGSKVQINIKLCAYKLKFLHPVTKEELVFEKNPNWKDEEK